jgi:hypothetical protein
MIAADELFPAEMPSQSGKTSHKTNDGTLKPVVLNDAQSRQAESDRQS